MEAWSAEAQVELAGGWPRLTTAIRAGEWEKRKEI
jgi:hypothetical protein